VARYGQAFKDRVVARLLPPESASVDEVAREVGIGAQTLERWRSDVLSMPARERAWTAAARLEAVIATAARDETARNAWCREHGVFLKDLAQWRESATQALAETAALLVLSRKLEAIFNTDKGEAE
jgi:transposase-like protein